MEKLNLILNLLIVGYIIVKEAGAIKTKAIKCVELIKEYIMAFKKQLIVKLAEDVRANVDFNNTQVAVDITNEVVNEPIVDCNGLSEEDAESPDFLLATCIAVGEDGHEEVIDFDLRGDSAAPLDFSMFGGSREQHYDLDIVKVFAGERRTTASYYAFEETAYSLRRQGKINDDYVMVAKITKEQILAVLNGSKSIVIDDDIFNERDKSELIEADAIIIDVDNVNKLETEEIKVEAKPISDEELSQGVEEGYEAYCSVNILKQAVNAVLASQAAINKQYEEMYGTPEIEEPKYTGLDGVLLAINNSRFAVQGNLPNSIEEMLQGGSV